MKLLHIEFCFSNVRVFPMKPCLSVEKNTMLPFHFVDSKDQKEDMSYGKYQPI